MVAVMKYSIMSVFLASLYFVGCGGSDSSDDGGETAPIPTQPQTSENTVVTTLGSNVNIASLKNVVDVIISQEDANNNPTITIQKATDNSLVEPFNMAKQILKIESGADYEVTLTSSKALNSSVDLEMSVPNELVHALNDQNALVAYIVIGGEEDDSEKDFMPVESTYNTDTQKLIVTLPDWSLQPQGSLNQPSVTLKLALAHAETEQPAVTTLSKMISLPKEGEKVSDAKDYLPKLKCPIKDGICIETSRYGFRKPGTVGAGPIHKGMDFAATLNTTLVSGVDGTVDSIIEDSGMVSIKLKDVNKYLNYLHLNKINVKKGAQVHIGDVIGVSGNKNGIKNGKQRLVTPHLHVEFFGMRNHLACFTDSTKAKTCNTLIMSPLDPMPYYVNTVKIVKTAPNQNSVDINQTFNIELQAFDVYNKQIETQINNKYQSKPGVDKETKKPITVVQPQGMLRTVHWSLDPVTTAYSVKTDAKLTPDPELGFLSASGDDLTKRSSSTVTVNKPESAIITAYWDGMENLKATYEVGNLDDPIIQADIELYYEYGEFPALRAIYDCINCDEKMLDRIAKWIYAEVECDDIVNPLTRGNTKYVSLEPPIKNKKGILSEYIDLETGYESYQLASLPSGQWSGSGAPPSKVTYECKFKDTEYGISYPDKWGINVRKLQLIQNPIRFSSTLVKNGNAYHYLPFEREK